MCEDYEKTCNLEGLEHFQLYNVNKSSTRFFLCPTLHRQFLWFTTYINFYKLVCLVHLHTTPQNHEQLSNGGKHQANRTMYYKRET